MNVEIGTEAPIFLFWEYLFQNFGILSLQCTLKINDLDNCTLTTYFPITILCTKLQNKL
jgi:hypothetical protein